MLASEGHGTTRGGENSSLLKFLAENSANDTAPLQGM